MPADAPATLTELTSHISRLGVECPWTRRQRTSDMIFYLRKELIEVEEEMRRDSVDGTALAKELGDVLFDALMLIEVTQREHAEVSLDACAASACSKLRRRCPYIFGGPPASTVEEAESAWQAAKRAEREATAMSPPPVAASPDAATVVLAAATVAPSPAAAPVSRVAAFSRPAAVMRSADISAAVREDKHDDDEDTGLAEWEADYRRNLGPPTDSEGEDDE